MPTVNHCADPMEPCWRFVLDEYSDDEDSKWWRRRGNKDHRDDIDETSSSGSTMEKPHTDPHISKSNKPRRRRSFFGKKNKSIAAEEETIDNGNPFFENIEKSSKEKKGGKLQRRHSKSKFEQQTSMPSLADESDDERRLFSVPSYEKRKARQAQSITRAHSKSRQREVETFEPVEEQKNNKPNELYFVGTNTTVQSLKKEEALRKAMRKSFFNRKASGKGQEESHNREPPPTIRRGRSLFRIQI